MILGHRNEVNKNNENFNISFFFCFHVFLANPGQNMVHTPLTKLLLLCWCARAQEGRPRYGRGAPKMFAVSEQCYLARCVIVERGEALRVTPRGRPLVDGLPRASSSVEFTLRSLETQVRA